MSRGVTFFEEGKADRSWCSKQDAQSHTNCAHPYTHVLADRTLTALVQRCVQRLARRHGCCERSPGEHIPHRSAPQLQQRGGCWRRCTGRRLACNGFSLWEQVFPGVCFLFPQMPLSRVVSAVCVAELLSSLCVLLLRFSCFLKGNRCLAQSNVCELFSS